MPYMYLQFPELKDFIAYLKSQNIDTVGIVERVPKRFWLGIKAEMF